MISAIFVGVGGALGTIVRFLLSAVTPNVAGIPLGTLFINLSGALALGWLVSALAAHGTESGRRAQLRLFVGTGVLGDTRRTARSPSILSRRLRGDPWQLESSTRPRRSCSALPARRSGSCWDDGGP